MSDAPASIENAAGRAGLAQRLLPARWPLAVLAAALALAWALGGMRAEAAAAVMAAVVAAAALMPRRIPQQGGTAAVGTENVSRLEGLSATDLAAAVSDAMIIFDRTGATVYANEAASAAFGSFVAGLPLQRKFRAPEMQELMRVILDGEAESEGTDYVERVPIEHVYRVAASRIRGADELFVMTFRDQSEIRRIDRMRADFIANASHELRTPLASIAGFVETLRGPARDDARAREQFLKIMHDQTARMARLIDDLLSLSRLETKPFLAPGAEVDLRQTLHSVIDSLGPTARDAGVVVETRFPEGSVVVAGSRDELFQVFENLLENACKYGQSGGRVVIAVERADQAGDGETTVSFRDFGPGIAAEHLPRVTERFYRVDVEASRGQKGTGLGLAIVKHILTRHKARLSIKSEVGKGSEFTVHFPQRSPSR